MMFIVIHRSMTKESNCFSDTERRKGHEGLVEFHLENHSAIFRHSGMHLAGIQALSLITWIPAFAGMT